MSTGNKDTKHLTSITGSSPFIYSFSLFVHCLSWFSLSELYVLFHLPLTFPFQKLDILATCCHITMTRMRGMMTSKQLHLLKPHLVPSVSRLMGLNSLDSLTILMILQIRKLQYSKVKSFTRGRGPSLPSGALFLKFFPKGRTKSHISTETQVE